ncbi:uncharacterized protein LOC8062690 isoform X2 [Sorghum bicolor]|uniref:Rx N-terminal domain-containing protein n=1 Tax=Sorghum bicolor TaxID=4558 RepID=C5Y5F7_SORBI|nr:uncharacterized protein LOC8062690 isoform X2 [Sorghum bicolor]EES10033.1 hypothetical protein SORBI_3005G171300 [Sorghum bicolor]|eukprot:XP_021316600.1 uncharacterized protein LOC8062690 isoform X2 [Sorghum bicolor]
MAAELVGSVVAQEAVNQILSRIKEGYQDKSDAKEHIERMEMAHIKLEAALETSNKWNVTSAPLLRWRSKLKRASQDCDNTLRRCRQRLQEEEEVQQAVRSSSFPKRMAHTAMSFVSSIFSGGDDDLLKGSTVARRFERFAEGASEFLRGQHLSLLLQPFTTPKPGMEGNLIFLLEDANAPENNFFLSLQLRLSESIDIVGVVVRCLNLFTPHLSSTTETVKTKLTQVPTQDLSWVSDAYSAFGCYAEEMYNLHTVYSKWFRPNPLCCQQQDHQYAQRYNATSSSSESLPCDVYMEPVIQVYLLGHVTLSAGNNSPKREFPYMKLGAHFWPHAPCEDLLPALDGSATEMINGVVVQTGMHAKVSFEQLGDITIPKAVDCLRRDVAATSYEIMWKSKHGRAYLQVGKTTWRATAQEDRGRKHHKRLTGKKLLGWASANNEFMCSWIRHAPVQLQSLVVHWFQKEIQLPQPLLLKTNSCFHYCPIMLFSLKDNRSLVIRTIKSSSKFNG